MLKLHHVGLVTTRENCEELKKILPGTWSKWEYIEAYQCWCSFNELLPLELIHPGLENHSLTAFINDSITCLHHIAFEVDDVGAFIDPEIGPIEKGACDLLVRFFKPKNKLLVELVQCTT